MRFRVPAFGAMLLAAGVLRLWAIDTDPPEHDEAYTLMFARGTCETPLLDLFDGRVHTAAEVERLTRPDASRGVFDTLACLHRTDPKQGPLYYLAAAAATRIGGLHVSVVRGLAAALGLLALPFMFLLARRLAGDRVAWIATALLAVSPQDVSIGRIARAYPLLALVVVASTWALLRAREEPTLRRWAGYAAAVALGIYAHSLFAFVLAAHAVWMAWEARSGGRALLGPWVLATAAGAAAYAPWALLGLGRMQAFTTWTERARPDAVLFWFEQLARPFAVAARGPIRGAALVAGLALVAGGAWCARRLDPPRRRLIVLGVATLLPFTIADLLLGGRRSTVTRYMTCAVPFLVILGALALERLRSARPRLGTAALVAALAAASASSAAIVAQPRAASRLFDLIKATQDGDGSVFVARRGGWGVFAGELYAGAPAMPPGTPFVLLPSVEASADAATLAQPLPPTLIKHALHEAFGPAAWQATMMTPELARARRSR